LTVNRLYNKGERKVTPSSERQLADKIRFFLPGIQKGMLNVEKLNEKALFFLVNRFGRSSVALPVISRSRFDLVIPFFQPNGTVVMWPAPAGKAIFCRPLKKTDAIDFIRAGPVLKTAAAVRFYPELVKNVFDACARCRSRGQRIFWRFR